MNVANAGRKFAVSVLGCRSMRAFLATLLLLTGGIAAVGWGWGWQERQALQGVDFTRQRVAFLEAENRRLGAALDARQRTEELAATATQRTEIERTVAKLRGMSFLRQVNYREIPRSKLPEILRQKLAQQLPGQEFHNTGTSLVALGLLPHGFDLEKTYFALLGEQVGAFYDQHSKELFTFSGQSLSNAQNRVILAHELTHALEDQRFDLSHLPLEIQNNDDRALAASALVEGDATLVMNQYMIGDLSATALKDSLASALTTDVRQLAAAPRYLRETLLFPYLHGLEFCQTLYAEGGWEALANAFAHPPASSAEILHPERFLAGPRREPVAVPFTGTEVLEQKPIADNVLGEFGARQFLTAWLRDDRTANLAAAGWQGDRVLVYGDDAVNSYIWRTYWADESGAERFLAALTRVLPIRYKDLIRDAKETTPGKLTFSSPDVSRGSHTVMLWHRSPGEIVLIDAQDQRWFLALQKLLPAEQPRP